METINGFTNISREWICNFFFNPFVLYNVYSLATATSFHKIDIIFIEYTKCVKMRAANVTCNINPINYTNDICMCCLTFKT